MDKLTDAQIQQWAWKHGLEHSGVDLRAMIEDARSIKSESQCVGCCDKCSDILSSHCPPAKELTSR